MNNKNFHRMWFPFFALILALIGGCTSSSHSDPSRYNLQFQAHPQINDSAPLKVRVLLLKSDADFMSSDFYSLQNNASATLGANLLNSDVFFLMPGQLSKTLSGQSSPEALYRRNGGIPGTGRQKMARLTSFACSRRKRDLPVLEMVRR